jgi:N-acetylated-alpha-linked acidic dipeptidase
MASKRPHKFIPESEPLLAPPSPPNVGATRRGRPWIMLIVGFCFLHYFVNIPVDNYFQRLAPPPEPIPLPTLEEIMLNVPSASSAREYSRYLTSGPHLGGKNYSQAVWMKEQWESLGVPQVEIVPYEIYTNYPKGHRLALLNETKSEDKEYELLFEASLEEDVLEEDPTSGLEDRIPTFHGYSASGNVTAEYVFANYGTYRDFEDLTKKSVNVTGKVVLCKYGKIFRGLKVKRAEELGAVGVLMYSDPGDDGRSRSLVIWHMVC